MHVLFNETKVLVVNWLKWHCKYQHLFCGALYSQWKCKKHAVPFTGWVTLAQSDICVNDISVKWQSLAARWQKVMFASVVHELCFACSWITLNWTQLFGYMELDLPTPVSQTLSLEWRLRTVRCTHHSMPFKVASWGNDKKNSGTEKNVGLISVERCRFR